MSFDPNAAASGDSGIFGLPSSLESSQLVYLPVCWEVTTSYGKGTAEAPAAILEASKQVDLFDAEVLNPYEAGLFCLPESPVHKEWNDEGNGLSSLESLSDSDLSRINQLGSLLNDSVYEASLRVLESGTPAHPKFLGLIGGDHSVPFGALKAIAQKVPSFGVLHLDAHHDLRRAYQGMKWSHASIFYNVLEEIPQVSKLVQVGIRDFCEQEHDYAVSQGKRVSVFYDSDLSRAQYEGKTWAELAQKIVDQLPQQVWISFDIDGLDPRYCPSTGTPVPGGLEFGQANYLFRTLVKSGRKIIGFDLNEVAPNLQNPENEWDANVGARVLYKLSAWLLASQGICKVRD